MEREITFKVKIGCTQELRYAIFEISKIIDFVGVHNVVLLKMK